MTRTIVVAGIAIQFRGDAAAMDIIDRRYRAFIDGRAQPTMIVDLDFYSLDGAARYTAEDTITPHIDGDRITLTGEFLNAEITTDLRSARVRAPLAERPIDAVLRLLLSETLVRTGGILAHAAAVVIDGAAWVFPGESGAGKSTIAAHLPGTVLGDEAIIVRLDDGVPTAHATPYWTAVPGHAPIAGFAFPRQGAENTWEALSPARTAAKLASCSGPNLPRSTPAVLSAAARLAEAAPGFSATLASISAIQSWLAPRLGAFQPDSPPC